MKKRADDSAYDILWEPETLKEYMELAEADLEFDELYALFPELSNTGVYARLAVELGVNLLKFFRHGERTLSESLSGDFETDKESVFWSIRHKWALDICRLWIYISRIMRSLDNPPCEEYWPTRPGIEGFGEVGRAALEVAELFACSVGNVAYDTLRSAFGKESYDELVYEFIESEPVRLDPTLDEKSTRWRNLLKDGLAKIYPETRWPDALLERDSRRLTLVLKYEEDEALDLQNASLKRSPMSTEAAPGTGLSSILENRDAFMSYADLAAIFQVSPEVLRKRLDRHREKHPLDDDLYVEALDRGVRKTKYFYNVRFAAKIAERLRSPHVSSRRPSEGKKS